MSHEHTPILVSAAVVVNPQGEVFLGRAPKFQSAWIAPGGHIDPGETPEQAIVRELSEELGVVVKKLIYLQFHKWFAPDYHDTGALFHCYNYLAFIGAEEITLNDEYDKHGFFSLDEAFAQEKLHPSAQKILEYYQDYLKQEATKNTTGTPR